MKLWQKETNINKEIEKFTIGRDAELDVWLAKYDVLGNIAHAIMLSEVGLLTSNEKDELVAELKNILTEVEKGDFEIEEGVEDVHSQVELMLTRKLGDTGKKIHSGRSRNDQVLVDLKLYMREELQIIVDEIKDLFELLIKLAGLLHLDCGLELTLKV